MLKVGDKVVVVGPPWLLLKQQEETVGKATTIAEIIDRPDGKDYLLTGFPSYYFDVEIVLEEIYNSPLQKALREED